MNAEQIEARQKMQDAYWTGPRFLGLLGITLAIAFSVIYTIASLKSGDFTWKPFAHDPQRELPASNW